MSPCVLRTVLCACFPLTLCSPGYGQTVVPAAAPGQTPGTPAPQPIIELDLPLIEGDLKVSGHTNVESKTVIVRVFSGWSRASGQEEKEALKEGVSLATDPLRTAATTAEPDAQTTQRSYRVKLALERRSAVAAAQAIGDDVRAQTLECLGREPVMTSKPIKVDDAGAFEVLLPQRLNGGDCVVATEHLATPINQRISTSTIVRSSVVDLGRLRGYFSIGGSVSQTRSHFSQVDTFVGFTTDSRLLGELVLKEVCTETPLAFQARRDDKNLNPQQRSQPRSCKPNDSLVLRDTRWQINAFSDAQVGFQFATTGNASDTTSTSGEPVQPPFQRPDQLRFGADQPGYFEIGLHAPLSYKTMDWRNDGRLYSFYLGPIVKWGVQAFDSPVVVKREVQIDKTKPETDTARFRTTNDELLEGALPFVGYGIRVGVYRYELLGKELRQRQIANDPIGYFDITWGKSTAYRSYTFARTLNDAGTVETVTIDSQVRRRLAMAGRLKLPYIPALIGVEINVRGTTGDQEPNEFRFLVAFRIDAQKALGRVFANDALMQDR